MALIGFHGGRNRQQLVFGDVAEWIDPPEVRFRFGEGAGLIEDHSVHTACTFERPSILDENAELRRALKEVQHPQRRGDLHHGNVVGIDRGQRGGWTKRRGCKRGEAQGWKHGAIGDILPSRLNSGTEIGGIGEHFADLGCGGLRACLFDVDLDSSG